MDINDRTRIRINNSFNNKKRGIMRSDKGFLGLAFLPIIIWLYFIVCWIVNLVKLVSCDFDAPYKDEIIHAIGLIGPAAGITAWF